MAQLDSWRIFCDSILLSWSEHLNARPYVQWIHYESLHLLLGMEIPDPITPLPKNEKHRRELGYSKELAWEMDDYVPLLNPWKSKTIEKIVFGENPIFLSLFGLLGKWSNQTVAIRGGWLSTKCSLCWCFGTRVLKSPVDVPSVNQHSNGILSPFSIGNASYRVHFPASYVISLKCRRFVATGMPMILSDWIITPLYNK